MNVWSMFDSLCTPSSSSLKLENDRVVGGEKHHHCRCWCWNGVVFSFWLDLLFSFSSHGRSGKGKLAKSKSIILSPLLCSSIANFCYYDEEYESDWHHSSSLLLRFSNLFEDAVSGILFLGPEWLFNNRCSLCSQVCVLLLQIDAQCMKNHTKSLIWLLLI